MSNVLAELERLVRARLGSTQPLTPETDLVADLALDSIQQLDLVVELENHFRVMLDVEDEGEIKTVGDLVRCIERARSAP